MSDSPGERPAAASADPGRDAYIVRRRAHIDRFWRRVGGRPDLTGKRVLELGCGYGELVVDMAQHGAAEVVGVDIDPGVIEHGQKLLAAEPPEIVARVRLLDERCRDLPADDTYDAIVSRDAFEHIIELPAVVADVVRRLRPGGRLYLGFGPLYRSPYGGHHRMHIPIPWGHLLLPERWLVAHANRYRGPHEQVNSIEEMGLNKLPLRAYETILRDSGLRAVYWQVNHGERWLSRLMRLFCLVPFLREYFSHDLYAVLEKPAASPDA